MKIFNYKTKKLLLIGDLHGNFSSLLHLLKQDNSSIESNTSNRRKRKRKSGTPYTKCTNTCMVVCGDCGFGFNKLRYYEDILNKINEILVVNDNVLLFVRGNHDNPSYFNSDEPLLEFSNIKFIPDYSVLLTDENSTLCVGGAISIDRAWRLSENARITRFSPHSSRLVYWKGENVVKNENIISELKEMNLSIDSIITHNIPFEFISSKLEEYNDYHNSPWIVNDDNLVKDMEDDWKVLSDLYTELSKQFAIKWWGCGHYHQAVHLLFDEKTTIFVLNEMFQLNIKDLSPERELELGFLFEPSKKLIGTVKNMEGLEVSSSKLLDMIKQVSNRYNYVRPNAFTPF